MRQNKPITEAVVVVDYDPQWPLAFAEIRNTVWPHVQGVATAMEHVGSTSVPGLAAKPILDIDIVIPSTTALPLAIERLEKLGYQHRGDLGITGRDAFYAPEGALRHNLYVCVAGCDSLKNHLLLRDRLRRDTAAREKYSAIKKELAARYPDSIYDYVEGKTAAILEILSEEGMNDGQLDAIRIANENPHKKK